MKNNSSAISTNTLVTSLTLSTTTSPTLVAITTRRAWPFEPGHNIIASIFIYKQNITFINSLIRNQFVKYFLKVQMCVLFNNSGCTIARGAIMYHVQNNDLNNILL